MRIQVLFFAQARELVGDSILSLEVEEAMTVGGLRGVLGQQFPALIPILDQLMISVDRQFAEDQQVLVEGVEVGLLPPVGGG